VAVGLGAVGALVGVQVVPVAVGAGVRVGVVVGVDVIVGVTVQVGVTVGVGGMGIRVKDRVAVFVLEDRETICGGGAR